MPSDKYVVCHLGAHKTATSLLQGFFKSKYKTLYEKEGVSLYPRRKTSKFIGWGEKIKPHTKKFREVITDGLNGNNVVAISNEDALGHPIQAGAPSLYPDAEKYAKDLRHVLKDMDVKISYYIRSQEDYIQSYYLQLVHQGEFYTFNQFLEEKANIEKLSWMPIIEALANTFGEENVFVGYFNSIKKGQKAFLQEFSSTFFPGIDIPIAYGKKHNFSISDRGLQMALRINPLLRKHGGETRRVRDFLQENFSNATEPRPILMTDSFKNEIKERYQEENEYILKKFSMIDRHV